MRKQPRINTAPIISPQAIQQGVFSSSYVISSTSVSVTNTTATTNIITATTALGLIRDGQAITFGTAIGGLSTGVTYYVVPGSITTTTFQVSQSPGGPVFPLSTAATGVTATALTYISVPVNSYGTIINLALSASTIISTSTSTVGSISGTGPWTATVSGMSTTAGLIVGQVITATNGTGSLTGGGTVTVASIPSSTSITITATGGTTPTGGTVTNITTATPQFVGAPTWYLDLTGVSLSVGYSLPVTVLISQGGTAYNPTILVNGITATLVGAGLSATTSRINAYYYTIICTAPNQYLYSGYAIAV